MENSTEKKAPLSELMDTTMSKIREMVDSNSIIGEPITTPDGVTVIPVSRVSFGFGSGGSDYGKTTEKFGGGGGAGLVHGLRGGCVGAHRQELRLGQRLAQGGDQQFAHSPPMGVNDQYSHFRSVPPGVGRSGKTASQDSARRWFPTSGKAPREVDGRIR